MFDQRILDGTLARFATQAKKEAEVVGKLCGVKGLLRKIGVCRANLHE